MADLEASIEHLREAVEQTAEGHPDRVEYLNDLGSQLEDRYSRTWALADLDEAIQVWREAVRAAPVNYPEHATYLDKLAGQLGVRYSKTGALADLEESIQLEREAVNKTPEDHPDHAMFLDNLGIQLRVRYSRTGTLKDLEESIQLGQKVVNTTSKDHPDRAMFLNNLGVRLRNKYLRTGSMTDLEASVQVWQEAVNTATEDDPDRALILSNLAGQLGVRYSRTGTLADLEESIQLGREAVNTTTEDHPDRAMFLNNLGIRLSDRYSRIGAMADLEEAIRVWREAVNAATEDDPDRTLLLGNLACQLKDRYTRTGALADLEESIQLGRDVVDTLPGGHPSRAMHLNNLEVRLSDRYSKFGAIADLEEAIQLGREAVQTTPESHPNYTMYLNNLGTLLGDRFARIGAMADIEESIKIGRQVIKAAPEDHPRKASWLKSLADQLRHRYSITGATADLYEAISYQETALHQENAFLSTRISAGKNALQNLAILSNWQQAYKSADTAVHLIPRLAMRSLENSDKQYLLGAMVGFASDAAAVALNAQKGAVVALDLLELGRGVLAASLDEIRVDTEDLQHKHPVMAERFVQLQAQARQNVEAERELDNLIMNIQSQPGFNNFLKAPSEEEILHAAQKGPIITINISQYRCDAIIVEHHRISSLPLPKLIIADITEKARWDDLGSPQVLEWLWDTTMEPILEVLGFIQSPSNREWPHVWWIPTGPLAKFPLHAAGYHSQGNSKTVLDRVMSSYSSSIKAIIRGRQRLATESLPFALLLSMQDTPGNGYLPFAAEEVQILCDMCKLMALHTIQPRRREHDIIGHMRVCQIFHFAGHGYTSHTDPSQSRLILWDGDDDSLTVGSLLKMNLHKNPPFLAYLSACGTGQIKDDKLIDESIHLTSAFQLAGFRHVIGTLWNVNDDICVDMARITYTEIANGNMDDESVCRGLHYAAREMRDRWLEALSEIEHPTATNRVRDIIPNDIDLAGNRSERRQALWVPYIHFGV
ncbi:hypothetical protein AN7129.2 [Aspergillus nidulans FGSC A4]|uniref:CHAT domain-containing protein n=1 Tax=Emericella nidulans (strain FGSC A4 / ATCC 38163 / CBS 112.46 / NRRL 194 / M139) TaxID=227321 RepID=Q5AX51_EMENI|nr:hypothetical protein [Aspergillus nidulans FGSC A4]EAA61131.1 hypothetical protein AN7129.2 [Aspergillus nidulans FGSC A4]CBF79016.1 TPA: conserved hypothetical protein [Aspergillus nidulans FGSC A4]|eukprot:XP_664733.1 hypothetical protein AN7129.2 [Aspergillus nidulans FGSC A4]